MTTVTVNSYTHSVTYVADNILKSLKDIIRLSGLDPSKLVGSWDTNMRALRTWIGNSELEKVVLEIYNPTTGALIRRWDIDVVYGWSSAGDGNFWTDTEQLRYAILKTGLAPDQATYDLILQTKPNRTPVQGWSDTAYRSTNGMVRNSLGSTIEHNGLGANAAYWRPV